MMTDRELDDALGKLGAPEGVAPRVDAAQVLARAASVRAAAAGTSGTATGAAIAWGSAATGVLLAAVAVVALRPLSVEVAVPGAAAPGTFGASFGDALVGVAVRAAAPEVSSIPPAAASTSDPSAAIAPAPRTIEASPAREVRAPRVAGRRAGGVADVPPVAPVAADLVVRVPVAMPAALEPDGPAAAAPAEGGSRHEEVEVERAEATPFDLRLWAQGGAAPASGAGAGAAMGAGFAWSPALGGAVAPEVWLDLGVGASEGEAPRPGAAPAWTGLARVGAGATFGSGSWRFGAAWTATAHLPLDAAPPEAEPPHVGLTSGPALALVVGRADAVTGRLGVAADLASEGAHDPLRVVPSVFMTLSVPLGEKI